MSHLAKYSKSALVIGASLLVDDASVLHFAAGFRTAELAAFCVTRCHWFGGRGAAMDEVAVRDGVFAWLRARMLVQPVFTRSDLASAEVLGQTIRIVGTQTGDLEAARFHLGALNPDGVLPAPE